MLTQQYAVSQPPIETLFGWIKSGEIAIPEIQRPFVWDATKVRNFLDSLYRGYPVGFLIAWKSPDVHLKGGGSSFGKRILIDGQQRVTALMAALLAQEVVNKDYKAVRIRIAFHPGRQQFEVWNPAIDKDPSWIPDISVAFGPFANLFKLVDAYCAANLDVDRNEIGENLQRLSGMIHNQIGLIELSHDLDIETVTEIFIRVNSAGVALSQADFAMSKIAADDHHRGNELRKAIDYFCHLAVAPGFIATIKQDEPFMAGEFFSKIQWLQNENDDLYDPSYTDMLRVAFTSEFHRGRLEDLVALLSGRNFETKQYEEAIIDESFALLKHGVSEFMNEWNFKAFVMIVRSAGFIDASMIGSQNALNFAYILYLTLKRQHLASADINRHVRRWLVMSLLTGRYSGSAETTFDQDIRQIDLHGIDAYAGAIIRAALSDAFWEAGLPQQLESQSASSPSFRVFEAAQVKLGDYGFLSNDITVHNLIAVKSDIHHIFPRDFLKKQGLTKNQYNQVANYVVTGSNINIAIGNKEPRVYFRELIDQCEGGPKRYGDITNLEDLAMNLRTHCIPESVIEMSVEDYPDFLVERRRLMAQKIQTYVATL